MKLMLIIDDTGRLMVAECVATGLLVFRHDGEGEASFLTRVRSQLGLCNEDRDSANPVRG